MQTYVFMAPKPALSEESCRVGGKGVIGVPGHHIPEDKLALFWEEPLDVVVANMVGGKGKKSNIILIEHILHTKICVKFCYRCFLI